MPLLTSSTSHHSTKRLLGRRCMGRARGRNNVKGMKEVLMHEKGMRSRDVQKMWIQRVHEERTRSSLCVRGESSQGCA
eukprot:1153750-Pelagomonas_calceolata.AAC.11